MQSPGLKSEEEFLKRASTLNIPQELAKDIFFYHDRARKAYEQREEKSEFLDGLSYYKDYILNRQAANTFLRPKKNDDEVRVNTGTTEKKIEVVWNELLKMTWDVELRAFDQSDKPMVSFGRSLTDAVKRTNEIEKDDDVFAEAVLEGLTQRAVYLEEIWDDGVVRDKRGDKIHKRQLGKAKKRLVSGLKVFVGDTSLPWYRFNEQPYIIVYDRIHWKEAERLYKFLPDGSENPMWKYVVKGTAGSQFGSLFGIRFGVLQEEEVEVLTYASYPDDEYNRIVAGVPMDKIGTKLPWEYEGYNMRQFGLKTMSRDSWLCKPLTASSKTLQSLDNETIRLMIRKFRQALEPPSATAGPRIFSKDIWSPAAITQNVKKDEIFSLINHTGVTQSEMAMFELIERKVEEFIGAGSLQQGLKDGGQQTATEIQTLQKQFATQLGNAVLMCMTMKREMSYLRAYNLLEHIGQPISKKLDPISQEVTNVYMSFTKQDTDLGDGRMGTKEIVFTDVDPSPQDISNVFEKEERMKDLGRDVRYYFVNFKKLFEIPYSLFVSVTQGFKDSQALDKIMFRDSLLQAQAVSQIVGMPLKGGQVVQEFEQKWKLKDWFQKETPPVIDPAMAALNGGQPGTGKEMTPQRPQQPSLNTLLGNIQ